MFDNKWIDFIIEIKWPLTILIMYAIIRIGIWKDKR